jgi:hypothetical protein
MSKIKINPEKKQDIHIKISYDRELKNDISSTIDYLNYGGFLYIVESIYWKMALNFYAETILTWTEVGKAYQPIRTSHERFIRSEKSRKNYTTNYIAISSELNNKINKAIMHLQSLIMSNKELKTYN